MRIPSLTRLPRVFFGALLCLGGWAWLAGTLAAGTPEPVVPMDPVKVTTVAAEDEFDETGMGTFEAALKDEPFSNDMLSAEPLEDDPVAIELASEVAAITVPSPAETAVGESRLNLRGFPTPRLRNGFSQTGLPEILNVGSTIIIQGPLIPVLGRAAPGGIQNFMTSRPREKARHRCDLTAAASAETERWEMNAEATGPLVAKRSWQRLALNARIRRGPEDFSRERSAAVSGAVTLRHSKRASTMLGLDVLDFQSRAAPGVPEYRRASGGKIIGPYLPLADFNAYGPQSGIRRRSGCLSLQYDGQPQPSLALRAGLQAWRRFIRQDRFTTSVLREDLGVFEGTREPQRIDQPHSVAAGQLELTKRFSALKAEHKLMVSSETTFSDYRREQRGLSSAALAALPLSVRQFNPWAPDYYRTPYDPALYSRVITDRREETIYSGLEVSERTALVRGKVVITAGLREDWVDLRLTDRKPGAARPRVTDRVSQLSRHLGVNYQAVPSRLLLFANTSTAFEPSTRVDARTGRVQGNETTLGYEAGFKGRFLNRKFDVTGTGFTFFNRNISRRNPLYEDPVADANQTQPQLVAAGEERFTGFRCEGRAQLAPGWSATVKAVYTHAVTTASPDLPEEVGRPLVRMPEYTFSASVRQSIGKGRWQGFSWGAGFNYIASYVDTYENTVREKLAYPGYGVVIANAAYEWKRGAFTHGLTLNVRNLFDRDLLASNARVGSGRELGLTYRLSY